MTAVFVAALVPAAGVAHAVVGTPTMTRTPTPTLTSAVLFHDDFSGDLSKWEVVTGTWEIVDGKLQGIGEGGGIDAWIYAGNRTWTDYSLEARFESGPTSPIAAFAFRSTGHWQTEYRIDVCSDCRPHGYNFQRYRNGDWTELKSGSFDRRISNPALIRVQVLGNELRLYFDGMLVDSVADPAPLPAGRFALGIPGASRLRFDDVVVTGEGCGNGLVEPQRGEDCDDGNTNPSDGCSNACTICGNGIVTLPEACDDGNHIDGDGCDSNCTPTACGNGVRSGAEQCDDGNPDAFDGCTNECTVCGDGIVTSPEECDDGNTTSTDGCDGQCRFPHVVGTGTPESCTEAALDAGLAGGATVMFDCGPEPVTITLTTTKTITADTTIDGGGSVSLSGERAVRVFSVVPSATLNVRSITIADGNADVGGGIYNEGTLNVTNSTFSANSSTNNQFRGGAGIFNAGGTVTVNGSTLSGNVAVSCGCAGPSCVGGAGGAIVTGSGQLIVSNSTFEGNSGGCLGGGIFAYREETGSHYTVTVTNTTFGGNGASWGGAIGTFDGNDTLTIANSTFVDNGDRAIAVGRQAVVLRNTILADGGCDEFLTVTDGGHNLIEDVENSCGLVNGVNGNITVDEVITGINIALGRISVCECMPCDTDLNGVISIAELIRAVNYALKGCPFWNGNGGDVQGSAAAWIESMRRQCEERAR